MTYDFRVYFNRRRQWVDVYLHDKHPDTFQRNGGGRWGYYVPHVERQRKGKFGELHLVSSRVRVDSVDHEIMHLWIDIVLYYRKAVLTVRNEEKYIRLKDSLVMAFWREYEKWNSLT